MLGMEAQPQKTLAWNAGYEFLVLRYTGELQDPDNPGTIPSYTVATWFFSEAAYKARKHPNSETKPKAKVVLQRMFLDARKGGWSLLPEIQEIAPGNSILKSFAPLPEKPIRDAIGYYAVFTSICPQTFTSGNDWAIWAI